MIDIVTTDNVIPGSLVACVRLSGPVQPGDLSRAMGFFLALEMKSCSAVIFDLSHFELELETEYTNQRSRFFLRVLREHFPGGFGVGVIVPQETLGGLLPAIEVLGDWPLFESGMEAVAWLQHTRGVPGLANPYSTRPIKNDHDRPGA